MEEKINLKNIKDLSLVIIFFILLVIVVILFNKASMLSKEKNLLQNNRITIPILNKNQNNEIIVDLNKLNTDKETEYVFSVSNFNDRERIKEDIKYIVDITNEKNIPLKLMKNDSKKNLLTQKININIFKKNEKQNDIYKLIIPPIKNVKNKENIKINIIS